jgi:hypothetical protein
MHAAGRDWHDAHWLGAAVLILLLSTADALLTLTLMRHGAEEANPFMEPLIAGGGAGFAYWKMGLTAFGVIVLTAMARIRLFGVIPVGWVLYLIAAGYIVLVAYELRLLHLSHLYGTDFVSYWRTVPLQLAT